MQDIVRCAESALILWEHKLTLGLFLGWSSAFFGITEQLFICISLLMLSDLCLGVLSAMKLKNFNYTMLKRGFLKFVAYFLSMFLINIVDVWASAAVGTDLPLQDVYLSYLVITEVLSIMTNCSNLGLQFPALVERIIRGYKQKVEDLVEERLPLDEDKESKRRDDCE